MRVLIFGLGLNQGGVGSALFFAKKGDKVKVTDLKTQEILKHSLHQLKKFSITYTLGKHKNSDIDWADLIIKNPGVKPGNQYIEYAKSKGKKIEQDMGIFLDYVNPTQIIGVTGTKGKSTTATLIYEMLQNTRGVNPVHPRGGSGRHVGNIILAGNIGKSVLDTIPNIKPETLVVLEISSFQLESFDQHKVSLRYAVITNIYPDHLNYYKDMEEYIAAKRIVGEYQTPDDFLFINRDDYTTSNSEFLRGFKGQIIFYSSTDLPADFNPNLIGKHNKSNMAAARAVGKTFGIGESAILETLKNFKGIPFRMEEIMEWNGIKIINDTTATGPDAAIRSIKTFPNGILIAGGMNKGMDYTELAKVVDQSVKKVFFMEGDSTNDIKRLMKNQNLIAGTYNDLEKLLTDVKQIAKQGDIILFSPAATSFNLFQNEFDRGRKFNIAAEKVFGKNIS